LLTTERFQALRVVVIRLIGLPKLDTAGTTKYGNSDFRQILLGHDSGGTAETLGGWGGDDALASALSDDAEPPRILE
jgi:hypothetical protein